MLQPVKLSTPATAFLGFAEQVMVAPAGVVMVRVIEAVLVVTVVPPASWTVTRGWVPKALPALEFEGLVVKASLVAVPEMVKLALTALLSPLEAAISV
jgi:hypothetical protein